MYIPVLTHPLAEVVERWPWDVIIDAQTPGERLRAPIKSHAEMTIALGPGPIAGVDCDLVIETFGPDPGATLRSGAARSPSRHERDKMLDDAHPAVSLETGIFTTGRIIGETVAEHEPLGTIGAIPVVSPVAGRIRGLQRSGRAGRRWRRGCRYRHQGDNASQRQRQDQSADRAWSRLRNRYGVCWLGSSFLRRIPVIAIDRMRAAARPGRKKSFSHGLFCEVEGEIFLRRRRSRSCPAPAPS